MGKTKELLDTQERVKTILSLYPSTRDSDSELYIKVCTDINPAVAHMYFADVFNNRKELGIPCFETVRRARQKLQSKFCSLRGSRDVEAYRGINEEKFKEYARR